MLPLLFGLLFLGSVAGLSGGLLLIWKEGLAKKYSVHLISFAAGVILAIAFLDLIPEALELNGEPAYILMLAGLVMFFLTEDLLLHFHHHEGHEHSLKSIIPLVVGGDAIHNFIDGIVISASFLADPHLGFLVALATFFHEIPQEIGDFGVLLSSGISKMKALYYNLFSALATFAGAFLTIFLAESSQTAVGPLIAVAAGMFIYIASADILPELVRHQKNGSRWQVASFFLTGIALVFVLTKLIPG